MSISLLFALLPGHGAAATLFLPFNAPIAHDVERLAVVSDLSMFGKPYSIEAIRRALAQTQPRYPMLAQRIARYMDAVYGCGSCLTHIGAELRLGDDEPRVPLPNRYGDDTRNTFALYGGAHWSTFDSIKGAFGGTARITDEATDGVVEQGYVSLGGEKFQLDIGYRDHWFAAGRLNSPLVGINSETYPSLTLSNTTPFTWLGFSYELFLGRLDGHDEILFGDEDSPGSPYIAATQLGFTFDNGFELAINRLFMFGGGERSVEGGDFLQAFFDPAAADNPVQSSCTGPRNLCEFGNQLLTLSTSAKLDYRGTPFQIHAMIGAEDTARGSNDHLGNMLMGFGLELPWLSADSQLGVDYAEFEAGWYVHHVYRDGYTHNGRIAGAGWGDLPGHLRGLPGEAVALLWVKRLSLHNELSLRLDHLRVGTPEGSEYADQLTMDWRSYTDTQRLSGWNMALILGDDIDDNRYAQMRFGYEW